MGHKIILCGGNGAGKTTLGKALASATGWPFRDVEDYYFPETHADYKFSTCRSSQEVSRLLKADLEAHENLIFASVRCKADVDVSNLFTCAVLVQTPREIRMQRVHQRSFQKFGQRMLEGGDLFVQEKAFFDMVKGRSEDYVSQWLSGLSLPVLRVDGTAPPQENIGRILQFLKESE
ncbi:MAG: hypothetical protein E7331_06155 [Clostridiales bacterium]|nr:hypothetical protein [Clostridiales bacterium]